jgi:hypothetical protein
MELKTIKNYDKIDKNKQVLGNVFIEVYYTLLLVVDYYVSYKWGMTPF